MLIKLARLTCIAASFSSERYNSSTTNWGQVGIQSPPHVRPWRHGPIYLFKWVYANMQNIYTQKDRIEVPQREWQACCAKSLIISENVPGVIWRCFSGCTQGLAQAKWGGAFWDKSWCLRLRKAQAGGEVPHHGVSYASNLRSNASAGNIVMVVISTL